MGAKGEVIGGCITPAAGITTGLHGCGGALAKNRRFVWVINDIADLVRHCSKTLTAGKLTEGFS